MQAEEKVNSSRTQAIARPIPKRLFFQLPLEVMEMIFKLLDHYSLARTALVSHRWHRAFLMTRRARLLAHIHNPRKFNAPKQITSNMLGFVSLCVKDARADHLKYQTNLPNAGAKCFASLDLVDRELKYVKLASVPSSVIKLTFLRCRLTGNDLFKLSSSVRKVKFVCCDLTGDDLTNLPSTITDVKISCCDLKKAGFESPNLSQWGNDPTSIEGSFKRLDISNCRYDEISLEKVPASVVEIKLSDSPPPKLLSSLPCTSSILTISKSYLTRDHAKRIPSHLRTVRLIKSKVEKGVLARLSLELYFLKIFACKSMSDYLGELSSSLWHLSIIKSGLKAKHLSQLPPSLDYLAVSGDNLSAQELAKIPLLSEKHLALVNWRLSENDLGLIPKQLQQLTLRECEITKYLDLSKVSSTRLTTLRLINQNLSNLNLGEMPAEASILDLSGSKFTNNTLRQIPGRITALILNNCNLYGADLKNIQAPIMELHLQSANLYNTNLANIPSSAVYVNMSRCNLRGINLNQLPTTVNFLNLIDANREGVDLSALAERENLTIQAGANRVHSSS